MAETRLGFFLFLLIFVINVHGENKCNVVINEINTGNFENLKKSDFIELKLQCESDSPKSTSLQGYKLIGISTDTTSNPQKVSIDLVINLWNSKFNADNLYTIGSEDVANKDMDSKSVYVSYRNKFVGNVKSISMFLSKSEKNVHAIAILYKKEQNFPELVLNSKQPILQIDKKMEDLIKTSVVDMVVYSRKAPYEHCEIYTKLYPEFSKTPYILREFDNAKTDRTLNRCSFDKNTFIPHKFKLGIATPGMENDCSGPKFVLENHLSQLTDSLLNKPFDEENLEINNEILDQTDSPQCTSSFDVSTYAHLSDDLIEEYISKETQSAQSNECTALDLGSDVGNIADELDRSNKRKRVLSETGNYEEELEWETTKYFE